jgi:hypothetical protein
MRKVPTPSGPFPFQLYFEDLGEIDEICLEALKRQSSWTPSAHIEADGGNSRQTRRLGVFCFPDRF